MIKKYPFTLLCILTIWVLCLCRPPQVEITIDLSFGFDKVVHFIMYAGTCSVMCWEYLRAHSSKVNWKKVTVWGYFAPIIMSGIIELVQGYATDYRGADWGDVLANGLGVTFAFLLGVFVIRPYYAKRHPAIRK